jgi:PAS domain S-box-containing protein
MPRVDGQPPADLPAIPAGSETGTLIAAFDWSTTATGPIESWPRELTNAVSLILAATVPMVIFWGEEFIGIYNDAYASVLGNRHPESLGGAAQVKWARIWENLGPIFEAIRATGQPVFKRDQSIPSTRGNSGIAFYDITLSSIPLADGTVGGVLGIIHETTERVEATRAIAAENERLASMFEQAPSFMALLREPGHVFEFANKAYQRLVGDRALIGLTIEQALPEVISQRIGILNQVIETGQPFVGRSVPLMLLRPGEDRPDHRLIDVVYQPIRGADGIVTGIFIEGSDVTHTAQMEEKLALSESSLRLATDVAEVGTWDVDLVNNSLEWSDRTKAMFGVSPDAPCTLEDFYGGLHPDDRTAVTRAFLSALDPARRSTYDVEYRTIGKEDGLIRWVAAKGRGIFVDGTCVRAIGTAVDISAAKRAENELRESERRFRSMADSAPALIWMCDADGELVFANRWHEETFGRPAGAFLGAAWHDVIHPDDVARFTADFDAAFAGRAAFSRDVRVIDRTGAVRWLHSEARPRDFEGVFAGYVGCDVDITDARLAAEALERGIAERTAELAATNRQLSTQIEERERVEDTLRRMQRLEAIGQLTSGVAHDFNNLLTVVLGNVDMVELAAIKLGGDERMLQRLGRMRTAAERGAALTAQLLAFSRRQRLESRATNLNETVEGMRDLLQSSMGGSVKLDIRLQPDLWPALVDPTQIELIILNLAINARDAMEVGGSLLVETANVTLGDPIQPEEPGAGNYVMVAVTDDGTGMTPEVLAKAFEPFFTTKEVGKGSGLGLPQVFGFARQSGGGVRIDTALGFGTTVRVYLPRSMEEATAIEPRQTVVETADRACTEGKRILLVDDDAPVRDVSASMLRALGCLVDEAGSGGAALEQLGSQGNYDLLVVDFAMPGMNGAELAAAAARGWPTLPVLYVTGFADLSSIAGVSEENIVQKPYHSEELQRKVRQLLRCS